jgi:hypothetical protein
LKHNYRGLNPLKIAYLTLNSLILKKRQQKQWVDRYSTIRLIPTSVDPEIHVSWWNINKRNTTLCVIYVKVQCSLNMWLTFRLLFYKVGSWIDCMLCTSINCVQILSRRKRHLSFKMSRLSLGPAQSSMECVRDAVSTGTKWLERESGHFPPSDAELKKTWSCTLCVYICLYWVHRKSAKADSKNIFSSIVV